MSDDAGLWAEVRDLLERQGFSVQSQVWSGWKLGEASGASQNLVMLSVVRGEPRPARDLDTLEINGIRLLLGARDVFCDGQRVELTTAEFDILKLLMETAGQTVSRERMREKLHHRKPGLRERSIDMHISSVRRKLGPRGNLIRTVRGIGYLFRGA